MIRELKKHPGDYLALLFVLGGFIFAYFWLDQSLVIKQGLFAGLGCAYFVWGLMHHKLHHTLTTRVVLEYFFVSLLATTLVMLVTVR